MNPGRWCGSSCGTPSCRISQPRFWRDSGDRKSRRSRSRACRTNCQRSDHGDNCSGERLERQGNVTGDNGLTVVITSEERFDRTPDGAVWGLSGHKFWSRYLDAFQQVRVVARVRDVAEADGRNARIDGPGVAIAPVPYYVGPREYLRLAPKVSRAVLEAFRPGDAVIMRIGSHLASPLFAHLRRINAPFGVEVVGDPYEVFSAGVFQHPLRPVFRWWFTR